MLRQCPVQLFWQSSNQFCIQTIFRFNYKLSFFPLHGGEGKKQKLLIESKDSLNPELVVWIFVRKQNNCQILIKKIRKAFLTILDPANTICHIWGITTIFRMFIVYGLYMKQLFIGTLYWNSCSAFYVIVKNCSEGMIRISQLIAIKTIVIIALNDCATPTFFTQITPFWPQNDCIFFKMIKFLKNSHNFFFEKWGTN